MISRNSKLKQHHHVRITVENKLDLLMWQKFLQHPSVFYRPFMDLIERDAEDINLFFRCKWSLWFRGLLQQSLGF